MYETFGPAADHVAGAITFRLFFPDSSRDILQYGRGGLPKIRAIAVAGTFHAGGWDPAQALPMALLPHERGLLYVCTATELAAGFYQYKFVVSFENGERRWVNDPCTRYSCRSGVADNSGVVIGGQQVAAVTAVHPMPPQAELVIYELTIDDFTANRTADRSQRNQLDIVRESIDHLVDLGVNAVEPLPWTAVPGGGFNWGYEPFLFFSVDERLTDLEGVPAEQNVERLSSLRRLIDALHQRGVGVIMDGVFNHVRAEFPYLQLYQDREDCPFIGQFEGGGFFEDFDFENGCTREFILDVCCYWIDRFGIDGIRFDYVRGFFRRSEGDPGITTLIANLRRRLEASGRPNFPLLLENLPDDRYQAIDEVNRIGASGTWFDPLMFEVFDAGRSGQLRASYLRALDAGRDFAEGRGPVIYVENHDHGTLVNKIGGDRPGVERSQHWYRAQPHLIALFTACGAVMLHNGQEFGEERYLPESGSDRVRPRPLQWQFRDDAAGKALMALHRRLIRLRREHPGLTSAHFHPRAVAADAQQFDRDGYGIDAARQLLIMHRWGRARDGSSERFVVVINFSAKPQWVDVPFPFDGLWTDLLSGSAVTATDFRCRQELIDSHYGRVFHARG